MIKFLTAIHTDAGTVKQTNQDSMCIKSAQTCIGNIMLAVVCDGMGGLEKGELASATVVRRFSYWFENELPLILHEFTIEKIRNSFDTIIKEMNDRIKIFGEKNNVSLGTTLTAIFLTEQQYLIAHVGDSRAYIIDDNIKVLTDDQTVVARELKNGLLTEEQARLDPRRNVLLQCIGASACVVPEYIMENISHNAVYMICSDGFRHTVSQEEFQRELNPYECKDEEIMREKAVKLVELNKIRSERDNISVILIRPVLEDN